MVKQNWVGRGRRNPVQQAAEEGDTRAWRDLSCPCQHQGLVAVLAGFVLVPPVARTGPLGLLVEPAAVAVAIVVTVVPVTAIVPTTVEVTVMTTMTTEPFEAFATSQLNQICVGETLCGPG